MPRLTVTKGTKFYIAFPNKENNAGGLDYSIMASFEKSVNDVSFLISAPLKAGRPIPLDISRKMAFKYTVNNETYILEGYADSAETIGIRTFWKIRKVNEARTFIVRNAERISAAVKVRYSRLNWISDDSKTVMMSDDFEPGLTLDISASGIALFMNDNVPVGEVLLLWIPPIDGVTEGFILHGEACWTREVIRNSFKYITGFKFVFDVAGDRDKMAEYSELIKNIVINEEKKEARASTVRKSTLR